MLINFAFSKIKAQDNTSLIDIVDKYILETINSYEIINEQELLSKIGIDKLNSLKAYLQKTNKEKAKTLDKEAINNFHISVLEQAGETVTSYWWGKKIEINNYSTANKIRNIADAF